MTGRSTRRHHQELHTQVVELEDEIADLDSLLSEAMVEILATLVEAVE